MPMSSTAHSRLPNLAFFNVPAPQGGHGDLSRHIGAAYVSWLPCKVKCDNYRLEMLITVKRMFREYMYIIVHRLCIPQSQDFLKRTRADIGVDKIAGHTISAASCMRYGPPKEHCIRIKKSIIPPEQVLCRESQLTSACQMK